ncbi:hypothetical protein [Ethanoligenens sp.]|uniref:hypothetical protein n=1 Tax=Ethanoligenens sp. TaxID=2099655 RepID=UPI0039ED4E47
MPPVSDAQKRATTKFERNAYDKILLRLPKGQRGKIKSHAENIGMSLNAYVVGLIEKDMR